MRVICLVLITLLILSCDKKEEVHQIDINVDLKDDVSPVAGEISIPGSFDFIEWTFEEIYMPTEDSPNPAWHIFSSKGTAKIKVTAYKNDTREKFTDDCEITVPDVARKIKISGFCFKNLAGSNPYNQKQITFSITFQKPGNLITKNFSIPPAGLLPSDTISLPEPIIWDINGFEKGTYNEYEVFITVSANQDNNLEFRSNFNMTSVYYHENPWNPGVVQVSNVKQNQVAYLFLLCDWLPN